MRDSRQIALSAISEVAVSSEPRFPVLGRRSEQLLAAVRAFSSVEETMLLSGPSGAGKSRLAQFCHACSARANGPFQAVDLLSIPEEMQMAELFGWRRGAFTGAVRDHEGFVAESNAGTLFIDEIDKLSMRTQAGLLMFMESKTFRALGDSGGMRTANVRLIVATNVNLRERVASGAFREDLYFRISVLPIRVPSLREREDEVVPWARFMLERCHAPHLAAGDGSVTLDDEAAALLSRGEWPGNLRQLDNVVRRAYALARATPRAAAWLVVERAHVERALGCDQPSTGNAAPLSKLREAADDFFARASDPRLPGALRLEDARAFEGLVLEAGLRRLGDLAEVYRLLGCEALVEGRNHHRHYRRELARVAQLERAASVSNISPPAPDSRRSELARVAEDEVDGDVDRSRFVLRRV